MAYELCPGRIDRTCYERVMREVAGDEKSGHKISGFKSEYVDQCVKNSFENKGTVDYWKDENKYFKSMAEQWQEYGTHLYPSVVINDVSFRGQFNPDNVFEDICASFDTQPEGCLKWLKKEGIPVPGEDVADEDSMDVQALIYVIVLLIVVNIILVIAYRSCLQKEIQNDMKLQVSSAVSQYVALSQVKELQEPTNSSILDESTIE